MPAVLQRRREIKEKDGPSREAFFLFRRIFSVTPAAVFHLLSTVFTFCGIQQPLGAVALRFSPVKIKHTQDQVDGIGIFAARRRSSWSEQ
jgi:hypothetical protein